MSIEVSNMELAAIFKALGDPTRLGIFEALRCCSAEVGQAVAVDDSGLCRPAGSLSVGEVCCRIGGSGSTISHHLKELRLAGLIRMEKQGRSIFCSVNPEALRTIQRFAAAPGCGSSAACCPAEERQEVGVG